jgi:hypothetical protein
MFSIIFSLFASFPVRAEDDLVYVTDEFSTFEEWLEDIYEDMQTSQFNEFIEISPANIPANAIRVPADPNATLTQAQVRNELNAALSGGASTAGRYVVLTRDINVGSWTPVNDFRGTLDGNGFIITLSVPAANAVSFDGINIGGSARRTRLAGLFGRITSNVTIRNLGVTTPTTDDAIFARRSDDNNAASSSAGGLVGSFGGTGVILTIERSFVDGNITALSTDGTSRVGAAGGLIGHVNGGTVIINDAYARGTVTAQNRAAMPLIPTNNAGFSYAGGFVGFVESGTVTINRSYVTNTLASRGGGAGSVRMFAANFAVPNGGTVNVQGRNNFRLNTQSLSSADSSRRTEQGTSLTDAQMRLPANPNGTHPSFGGWDFINIWETENNDYPFLRAAPPEPILISTAATLAAIGGGTRNNQVYRLTQNIDLSGHNSGVWIPIDNFRGILDGNGFIISNLHTRQADGVRYAGLFGRITSGNVTIRNLKVEIDSKGLTAYGVSGNNIRDYYAGGLIALCEGGTINIENVAISGGRIYAYKSSTGLSGNADAFAGGFIGRILSNSRVTIRNSYAVGSIETYATQGGTGSADSHAGGLVGNAASNTLTIENCYAANTVTADGRGRSAGGLIGSGSLTSTSRNNFRLNTDVSSAGQNFNGVNGRLSLAQMNPENLADAKRNFNGFNFDTIWDIDSGHYNDGFPILRVIRYRPPIVIEISTAAQLRSILNSPEHSGANSRGKIFKLTSPTGYIDLDHVPWTPINDFRGIFDGNGQVIKNLHIAVTGDAGLFGRMTVGSVRVMDLGVEISYKNVRSRVSEQGGVFRTHAGGLIGYISNSVRIENCYVAGSGMIIATSGSLVSTVRSYAGGLIGRCTDSSSVIIKNSYVNVRSIEAISSAGNLLNDEWIATAGIGVGVVGAIIAANLWNPAGWIALGITSVIAVIPVFTNINAHAFAGGFIGHIDIGANMSISNCYSVSGIETLIITNSFGRTTRGNAGYLLTGASSPDIKDNHYLHQTINGGLNNPSGTGGSARRPEDMITQNFVNTLNGNPSSNIWSLDTDNRNGGFPILRSFQNNMSTQISQRFLNGALYIKDSEERENLVHITEKNRSQFSRVSVNGSQLSSEQYTIEGTSSTNITLLKSYLDSLPIGSYTLTIEFSDGISVATEFTVTSTANIAQISKVYMNGNLLTLNTHYLIENSILKFLPSYLETLGEGTTHTLTIHLTDGTIIEEEFTIPPVNVIAWSDESEMYGINLTQEIMVLPVGYTVGMYRMTPPGRTGKWVNASRRPLNNRNLSALLNRGGVLTITSAPFVKNYAGNSEVDITFPSINPRPKTKYAVNYSFGASTSADNLGTWTIAAVVNRVHVVPVGGLVATQPTTGRNLTAAQLDTGTFKAFTSRPMVTDRNVAKADFWFVRENAVKEDNGTYTPASRPRRFAGRPAARAPAFNAKVITAAGAANGTLRVRKGWTFTKNNEAWEATNAIATNVQWTATTHAGEYVFWVAPTPTKPPSQRSVSITIGVPTQ